MTDSTNPSKNEDRRRFLFRATAAAVAAGAVFPACGPMGTGDGGMTSDRPNPIGGDAGGEVDTGVMAASLIVGTIRKLDLNGNTITVVIGRDGMGYYAMDGICTHTGCPIRYMAGDPIIGCTCNHGSTFAFDGALLSPATSGGPIPNQQGLPHFAMRIAADGKIFVSVGQLVPRGMRYQAM